MLRKEVAIQQSGIRALDETTRNAGLYEAAQERVAARSTGRRAFDRLRGHASPKTALVRLLLPTHP